MTNKIIQPLSTEMQSLETRKGTKRLRQLLRDVHGQLAICLYMTPADGELGVLALGNDAESTSAAQQLLKDMLTAYNQYIERRK